MSNIPLRNCLGPTYQASKWLTCQLLIDVEEMERLFDTLGHFWMVQISGVIEVAQAIVKKELFLELYGRYISALKRGEILADNSMRSLFSSILTVDLDALYRVKVNDEKEMVKICKPVVQLQSHRFDYSTADSTFRSMVLGQDSIHWGLQISYPHLYQDENLEVFTVRENAQFPNTVLFKNIQRWMRQSTIATPFKIEGKRINAPMRLGKACLNWINAHPQLKARNLIIDV